MYNNNNNNNFIIYKNVATLTNCKYLYTLFSIYLLQFCIKEKKKFNFFQLIVNYISLIVTPL